MIHKINFKFFFIDGGTMESSHVGEGETKALAIVDAWQKMAKDIFDRKLILTTFRIEAFEATT